MRQQRSCTNTSGLRQRLWRRRLRDESYWGAIENQMHKTSTSIVWAVTVWASCATACSIAQASDSAEFLTKFNEKIQLLPNRVGTDKLDIAVPNEGYYSCLWGRVGGKPFQMKSGNDLNNSLYVGFNFHADGTVRLRMKNKMFEEGVSHWRHNPTSGRVVFTDGPLSKIFAWPTHLSTWWSSRWISRLAIDSPEDSSGLLHFVSCTNKDRLLPYED